MTQTSFDGSPALIAGRAYKVARAAFARWAGEIEDLEVVRARAVQGVVREHGPPRRMRFGPSGRYEIPMTEGLRDALSELECVEVEGVSVERETNAVAAARAARA